MKKTKILDCTLRDGGYYNDWDFDYEKAKELIKALNEAGVDIIEVGYKSIEKDKFYGLFKYCSESALTYLKEYSNAEYAFMIDLKEFLGKDNKINIEALNQEILPAEKSLFQWVRIASHFATINNAPEFIDYFTDKGYKVGFNLMGGSLLKDEQIISALKIVETRKIEYFYIADSFGSFYPEEVVRLIKLIQANYKGKIGIHTHDNQGLAYANTLAAIECGVDIVDATLTGMGRGAGNLMTEQFLLGYAEKTKDEKIQPSALLNILQSYMLPMKLEYGWGFNYTYMLSGLKNIHPTYGQNVNDNKKFTMAEISGILENIPVGSKEKYSDKILVNTINTYLHKENSEEENKLPLFNKSELQLESAIVISGSKNIKPYLPFIKDFIEKEKVPIIECNNTELLKNYNDRIVTILNKVRMDEYVSNLEDQKFKMLISGQPSSVDNYSKSKVYHLPYSVGEMNLQDSKIGIPDYEAGMYSIMFALLCGAKKIFLAGFTGYDGDQAYKNEIMENFFAKLNDGSVGFVPEIISITPTNYKLINQRSVFSYL